VLPARDGAALLGEALAGFVPAAAQVGGRVLVVDDASSDGSGAVAAAAGASVVRLDEPSGPYVARNAGWAWAERHGAGVAVFVDVRCRPRPGWLPRLLAALDGDGVTMAAGEVVVRPTGHVAGRAAARLQPLALRHGRDAAYLPYAPTCHLAVAIPALRRVDGFRAVRGGGDVDLCWRLQEAGAGTIGWAEDAILDWAPRDRVRDLLSQHHRYGANSARLYVEHRVHGCPVPPAGAPPRVVLRHLREALGDARRTRPGAWPAVAVAALARTAQDLGYGRALRAARAEELVP
jgi:glycosyltransferase involved in cell wall biosynthesis